MTDTARRPGVQSVDRALDLIEELGAGRALGVSELVRRTGLPLGTVHRLLGTLAARGYVIQDTERRYAVGPAALRLGDAGRQSVADVGRPFAERLTAISGESCNIAVLQGREMVYVAQSPSPHSLRIFAEVGRRVPVYSTAVGKAVLSQMEWEQAERVLEGVIFEASTEHTITDLPALRRELQSVRRRGYAVDEQERELGVRCVAAPVTAGGVTHAAISVSGPAERFSHRALSQLAPQVCEVADDLARVLHA